MIRKRHNFITHSLIGALSFFKGSVLSDDIALQKGLLQSLDPRIKTITILSFIILSVFLKNIFLLLFLYLFCLLLACLSGIRIGFFLKRTWVFIPLFSFFIAIPALFNIFSPGQELFSFNILGLRLAITRQGLGSATLFIMRVISSVSFVILLAITTPHNKLLKVLRVFKIPQIFVMTIGICYRYIYLFVEIIENTYLAIRSRVGALSGYKKGQNIVAWNIAFLWQRSLKLNEEVYNAMLSRGYTGEPVILEEFRTKIRDWFWFALAVIIFMLTLWMN